MGKKATLKDVQVADIKLEITILYMKAKQRSLSANWGHSRYIWLLISDIEDGAVRRLWFNKLDVAVDLLNCRHS